MQSKMLFKVTIISISFLVTVLMGVNAMATLPRQTENAIEEVEKYIKEKKPEINQRYRPQYHVAGPVGWINDPNGFSYYKGEYHLFYQFYPYDSVWGPMHWGHVTSPDLVNWKQRRTALLPEKEQCFSGSAVVDGDRMVLMYTAHVITQDPLYNQSQYLAFSSDGENFEKYEGNPVISGAPNGSPEFRDPKVWRHEDHWYVILGSKTLDDRGRVLLYRSKDMKEWEYLTVLAESNGDLGYIWECPDFFELDGKFVLLMSPQGIEVQGDRFKNVHQTGYIIGTFNYSTFEFVPETEFQEIDFGHDFYAAQTTEVNGTRYLVAWFNMWEVPHPEEMDGWCGTLTIVRRLELRDNRILMKPVENMKTLRQELILDGNFRSDQEVDLGKTAEIVIEGDLKQDMQLLIQGRDGGDQVWLRWNSTSSKVAVVRGSDDDRQVEWKPISSRSWRIFLDASSLELFCGEGEVVFSSRVFPQGTWKITNLSPQNLTVEAYTLNRSVPI